MTKKRTAVTVKRFAPQGYKGYGIEWYGIGDDKYRAILSDRRDVPLEQPFVGTDFAEVQKRVTDWIDEQVADHD